MVIVVGAGPAGLLLAAELRTANIPVIVLERVPVHSGISRGFNLNARALDLLALRGLADRFIAEGHQVSHAPPAGLPVTLNLPGTWTAHPFSLGIAQARVEEILERHAAGLGADIRRGHELVDLQQDPDEVTATVRTEDGEYQLRGDYLAGCDGGRSTVRKLAGIPFPGTESTRFTLLGDVEMDPSDALPFGVTNGEDGAVFVIPRPGYMRIIVGDPGTSGKVTLDMFSAAVETALGRAIGIRDPRWLSRFGNATRLAERYVHGRIVLAGDSAHIHPPAGAIGVNIALDDAMNLGWKLAAATRGNTALLENYHEERHAVGAQLLASTRAQVIMNEAGERLAPLIELLTRVAKHPDGNRAFTETVTGLDTCYPMPHAPAHPWLGKLAPDLDLSTGRLSELLHKGDWLLLRCDDTEFADLPERLRTVSARCARHPELRALLVRPDGHIAWLDTKDSPAVDSLSLVLDHWFAAVPA